MADPTVQRATAVRIVTAGVALIAGDLLYFDGTNYLKADADDNTKFAEGIACNNAASGAKVAICQTCVLEDTDAPFTQGDTHYLSATAGENTATRPTGAVNLAQVVGFAQSATDLYMAIQMPREVVSFTSFPSNTDATGYITLASGDFGGPTLIDTSGIAYGAIQVPQNVVGTVIQEFSWVIGSTALDSSDTYTIDASGATTTESTTNASDGIAAAALTGSADTIIVVDVSAAYNAVGVIEPGNWVGTIISKTGEGTGGDDPGLLGINHVFLGV